MLCSQYSKPDQIEATKEGERVSAPSHYLTERPPPALVRGSGATVTILVSAADSGDAVGVIETVFPPGDGVLGTLVLRGIQRLSRS